MKKSATELLAIYQRLRIRNLHLNTKLTKLLTKEAIETGGKELGILKNGALVFGNMDESSVLMDHCLHTHRINGSTVFEYYLHETRPDPQSEDFLLLNALLKARYSIFQIEAVIAGLGAMTRDLLRGDEVFIVDVGLSATATENLILASRIMAPTQDFFMTTGAALPITKPAEEIILTVLESRFLASGRKVADFTKEEMADLAAFITRSLLKMGASDHIKYESRAESPRLGHRDAAHTERKPGRNEPCPCGSGKKYKKCCSP